MPMTTPFIDLTPSGVRGCRRFLLARGGWIILSAFLLLPLAGCGNGDRPPMGQVQGVVRFKGKPLASADIVFRPVKGRVSYGTTDANGHYELTYLREDRGAVVGTHTVQIFPSKVTKEAVPASYNTKSTLKKEVAAGKNEINIDLL
jgi:hypothetical protein